MNRKVLWVILGGSIASAVWATETTITCVRNDIVEGLNWQQAYWIEGETNWLESLRNIPEWEILEDILDSLPTPVPTEWTFKGENRSLSCFIEEEDMKENGSGIHA